MLPLYDMWSTEPLPANGGGQSLVMPDSTESNAQGLHADNVLIIPVNASRARPSALAW